MSRTAPLSERLDLIQVMRGLAALAVVLDHYAWLGAKLYPESGGGPGAHILERGGQGVDWFFCLSGFIITWIHGAEIGHPSAAPRFLYKRFLRIYPPFAILVVLKGLFYVYTTARGVTPPMPPGRIFETVFLLPDPNHSPMLFQAWTLSWEVFFYLLFCGAIVCGGKVARIGAGIWILGTLAWGLFRTEGELPFEFPICEVVFSAFNFEFLSGVLAAVLARRGLPRGWNYGLMLLSGGCVGGIYFLGWIDRVGELPAKLILALAFGGLLLSATVFERTHRIRVPIPLLFLGAASYSIYLVHQEVMFLMLKFAPRLHWIDPVSAGFSIRAGLILATFCGVAGGIVYYLLVEKPLLKWCRDRLPQAAPHVAAAPLGAGS